MQIATRSSIKKNTYDTETRTAKAIAATEAPVEVYSSEAGGLIREVLLMSGCELPDRVPLQDTHSRHTTGATLGSASGFQVQGDELHCQIEFSKEARADGTATKVQEGHLTDLSVGYAVLDGYMVPEGQTVFHDGRGFDGPLQLVTKWKIKELSICPIGADPRAKIRSYQNGGKKMPDTIPDTKTRTEADIRAEERARVAEITAMCSRFGCDEIGKTMVESGATVDQARAKVVDYLDKTNTRPGLAIDGPMANVQVGAIDEEKRAAAIVDGLILRSGGRVTDPAPGANDFRHSSLVEIAKMSLTYAGVRTNGMDPNRVIKQALQARMHSTSDFSAILAAVSQKTLRQEYELSPGTFALWTRPTTANDFKPIHRTQLSEAPGLVEVPEAAEYQYGSFGESEEIYSIITLGRMFSVTRQAIINDDLNALVRVPRAFAMAARRTLNKMVYAILLNNPNMADANALFSNEHSNLDSHGAISIAKLSTARKNMRLQQGLQGEVLNIAPRFLIVPAELETESDEILNTMEGYTEGEGTSRRNPFYRKLELVVDPELDADTNLSWFLAADPLAIDTIEVAYLHGNQTPYLETRDGWTVDGVEYKCRIDAGAKAIDWRGLHKTPSNND